MAEALLKPVPEDLDSLALGIAGVPRAVSVLRRCVDLVRRDGTLCVY